jgi:hypothetical protein
VTDLWLSLLAAALATGAKQTNIPLAALWFIAAWPALPLLWKNPLRTIVVAGLGLLVSIVPISVLNYHYCGTWMPLKSTGVAALGEFHLNPFWGVVGNALCIPVQNLLPPFYELLPPFYSYWTPLWNELMRNFLHTSFGAHFSSFENFGYLSGIYYHGISEGNAGLGLGLCIMIFAAIREIRHLKKTTPFKSVVDSAFHFRLMHMAPWGLLLLFMAKVGTFENARQLTPYYVFLFPGWLAKPAHTGVTRQRRWQRLGLVIMAVTAALVAASGDRPLFPARAFWGPLREKFPDAEIVSSECARYLESFYQITQARRDFVKRVLPKDETVVGYYAEISDVDETGAWLPYGHRRVECIAPDDKPECLHSLGIRYVLVNGAAVQKTHGGIQNWMNQYNATRVDDFTFPRPELKTFVKPDLYLVRLN